MARELSFMEELLLLPREDEEMEAPHFSTTDEETDPSAAGSLLPLGPPLAGPPLTPTMARYEMLQAEPEFACMEEPASSCVHAALPALTWGNSGLCDGASPWPGALGWCSVLILHARVAQKSYGSEKRFFCPPPCVYLHGPGWRRHQGPDGGPVAVVACMGILQEGAAAAGPRCEEAQRIPLQQQHAGMSFGCAKTLFVSDQDKRKHFRLELTLGLVDGQEIGSFLSRTIKVISKPSKKKQSIKNAELCIPSGSRVALFNRLRSQTVSTRYLHTQGGGFVASGQQWGAFTLHLVEDSRPMQGGFSLRDGFVRYGASVRLVCPESGLALPTMVIRKVEKQSALLAVDEPVSQLHKCALLVKGSASAYLCLSNDRIVLYRASPCTRDPARELLGDGACWTIIGTERVEHSFLQPAGVVGPGGGGPPPPQLGPVTPIPSITGLELHGGGDVATLELTGEHLEPGLKVWFGAVEAETLYSLQLLLHTGACVGPAGGFFARRRPSAHGGARPEPRVDVATIFVLLVFVVVRLLWGAGGRGGSSSIRRRRYDPELHSPGVHEMRTSSARSELEMQTSSARSCADTLGKNVSNKFIKILKKKKCARKIYFLRCEFPPKMRL
ncbi:recombining binding protein suppressor of hairless-like isoform X1 [Lethenteron reissneri]|uniref:recombining binding protein suppressor of hairless-like isoform X1 n=1 Tax=Lethenteron reissneri TaxID=7753 RepID=UPI002AB686D1|nr:recombining binding protein suppressor of hairless-like isoform X1 [Lethenteron reissneri]